MSDESLREFQLNGKQLVFLFMASTVVAVVIFLCGVMVGRGVSAAQAAAVTNSTVETGDPTAGAVLEPAPPAPAAAPVEVPPDVPGDDPDLKYPNELTAENPKQDLEVPRPAAKVAPTRTAGIVNTRTPAATTTRASTPATASTPPVREAVIADTEPAGPGFVVQVAATPRRSEADAIRGRLQQKGYPAFVTTAGRVFRVRVGKYKDRAEANAISKRLETEERFKPWVTR